ncbi:MAG: hypothetical protein K5894_09535 [Lachnospiraceae bacterium]|nr:hypothetical protein [Lachnospiraceae bacterium]
MFAGSGNNNSNLPLKKMKITNMITKKSFYVLYNPTTYEIGKDSEFGVQPAFDSDSPGIQFSHGSTETLSMQLFFDTFNTGALNAPTVADGLKLEANKRLKVAAKFLDVRKFTDQVYSLMQIEASVHIPPLVKVEWSSLQFEGVLKSCHVNFIKFTDFGIPVRATMDVVFFRFSKMDVKIKSNPFESPDTSKFKTVEEGEALWQYAAAEYGDPEKWREIAQVNRITNPRLIKSGRTVQIPSL